MPAVVHVKVVDNTVVAQRLFPMVQQTIEILQLRSIDRVFDVPVAQVQRFPGVRNWSRSHSCSR